MSTKIRLRYELLLHQMLTYAIILLCTEGWLMEYLGSQDWAISKLGKYRHLFWGISEEALARLNALPPSERLPWNPRVFADVLNSYVIDGARRAFEGKPNSRFVEENNTTYHLLNGCALWYKKLGSDGLPSNYPTETALDLMQGAFPFAPEKPLASCRLSARSGHSTDRHGSDSAVQSRRQSPVLYRA